MKLFAILIGTVLLMAGLSAGQDQKTSPQPQPPAQNVHQTPARETYRLDYTITEMEDGKKVNSRTYTLMCEDRGGSGKGMLKVGSRVPVATGSYSPGHGDGATPLPTQFTYLDVGMNIDAWIEPTADGGLTLNSSVEMSSVAETSTPNQSPGQVNALPVIRQLRASTNSAITPGKPVVISTADDVASHRQFQIQVVATKIK